MFKSLARTLQRQSLAYNARAYATVVPQSEIDIIPFPRSNGLDMGAEIRGADLNNLDDPDSTFSKIKEALYNHSVVLFKNQRNLTPEAQYELTRRFDPSSTSYGHGKSLDKKKSILHPDLKTIPRVPQVQVIGNGFVNQFEGLKDIQLRHPHHKTFHRSVVPEAEDLDVTRFYRWHIDAALYELSPPRVTSLMAVAVPKGRRQTLRYDDGTGDELDVPLGTTAFASGATMYDMLSPEQQEFVRTTKVQYAPHPYIWMSKARALSDGLGLHSEGLELPRSELPPVDDSKVKILPMAWKNPVTGKLALMVHPCAVEKLHLKDGTVIDDLTEVRRIVHELQRPGISPSKVYCQDWSEGDLVLFDNHSTIHSVVGAFAPEEVRIFRQCNLAASRDPLGPEDAIEA